MRRFELVDGSSSKFWQIEREGSKLTIQWGKIGTAGQSQVKDFPNDSKATAEHDKLISEKTKKGYAEVGAPAADAPAPKPRVAKPKTEKTSEDAPVAATNETSVALPKVEPVIAPSSADVEIDWSQMDVDRALVPHRTGRYRPSKELLEADPWQAVQQAWSLWKSHIPSEEFTIAAELTPAIEEALQWLRGTEAAPLSPLAAAAVSELLALPLEPACYPATRAMVEPSIAKYGAAWIWDVVEAATRIKFERYKDPPLCAFYHAPESIGPYHQGNDIPHKLAFVAQNLSDDAYAELTAAAESRWGALSYYQKLRVLTVIPGHTKLADALGEEWLACNGKVEGFQKTTYGDDSIEPDMNFGYSRAMLAKLAKKVVTRAYCNGHLLGYLWRQFDLQGADVLPMLKINCDAVDWAGGIVSGLEVAALIKGAETAALMVSHLTSKKEAAQFAVEWLLKNPALAMPALADSIANGGATGDRAAIIFMDLDRAHPGLADKVEMRASGRGAIAKLREKMAVRPEAAADELPRVLSNPPWLSARKAAVLPVVANVSVKAFADKIHEDADGRLAEARRDYEDGKNYQKNYDEASEDVGRRWYGKYVSRNLVNLKPADVKKAFDEWPAESWGSGYCALTPLVVMGEEAIAGYPRIMNGNSAIFCAMLSDIVESPKLAAFYAYARTLKGARKSAEKWLLNFPKAASVGLIPIAVGNHSQARDQADMAIRLLVAKGHGEVVREVAESYGKEVSAALTAALEADPRDRIPSKLPKIGPWCDVEKLPRPLLKGRERALSKQGVEALLTMLAISTPEATYIGLEDVLAVCDRASLEEFSWALFNQWQMGGAPSKENWAMQQLGTLGADEVARKLTPLIRVWPGESLQARAVAGLDVLARIGTDLALMHLNGIAQKIKFKGLQEKAREKMDEVAQNRGLTADELADRLVPDLDLDPDGSRTLDFGSRQFRVSFDEALKPVVVDSSGKTLTDLPKSNKSDDAAKAKEADSTWKTLKKDAKAIAQNQITRLELAMCSQRRWDADSFQAMFLEHPLLIHLVRRLIWGVYSENGERSGAFRVAEDCSLADMQDSTFMLPEGAQVGIVHPLELADSEKAAFGQILGDYGILQPFQQIGRDTYAPTAEEAKGQSLKRRAGHFVPTGKILGLAEKGWRKGPPQDAGWIWEMYKPLPNKVTATLDLRTGISADMQMTEPKQEIGEISVHCDSFKDVTLGHLSAVVFSELVRDIVQLGSAT